MGSKNVPWKYLPFLTSKKTLLTITENPIIQHFPHGMKLMRMVQTFHYFIKLVEKSDHSRNIKRLAQ